MTPDDVTQKVSSTYNRHMKPAHAAASVAAVVALLVGCASAHTRHGLVRASFPAYPVSFRYPAAWNRIDCPKQESSFTMTITYLTTARPGSCPSSGAPVQTLDRGGVLVWWWNFGFPGTTDRITNFSGRGVTGGRPARIALSSSHEAGKAWVPTPMCAQLGAHRLLNVAIERPAPADANWMMVSACLRGPNVAASEAAVRRMLATVRFRK